MNRIVLMSVLASVAVVALVAGLAGGGYAYHRQTSHVSKLKIERSALIEQRREAFGDAAEAREESALT
jgi:hypothetical protein